MTDTGFLFGPLGYMQALDQVSPGVTRAPSRARGELVTVGGVRYVQKAKHAPRQWEISNVWETPAAVRSLMAAAQGVLKDCWLYDVAAARANMLPGHLTAGAGSPVVVGWGRRNLAINPSSEIDIANYFVSTGTGGAATLSQGTGGGVVGAKYARATWTTAGSSASGIYYRDTSGATSGKAGDVVSGGVWVRYNQNVSARLSVTVRNGATDVTSQSTSYVAVTANTWTFFKIEGIAVPADYTYVQLWPSTATSPVGLVQDVDGLPIEKTPTLGAYFDGDTPGAHWAGAQGASAAVFGGFPLGAIQAGQVATVPVLAGRQYTVSAWTETTGAVLSYQLGSGSTVAVSTVTGRAAATFTPAADQILTVTVTAAGVAGLRVHEGAADGDWYPGHGSPCKVDVIDPQAVLQLVTDGHGLTDYTVSLQEVGIPGVI